jgi:hypothetical protein
MLPTNDTGSSRYTDVTNAEISTLYLTNRHSAGLIQARFLLIPAQQEMNDCANVYLEEGHG